MNGEINNWTSMNWSPTFSPWRLIVRSWQVWYCVYHVSTFSVHLFMMLTYNIHFGFDVILVSWLLNGRLGQRLALNNIGVKWLITYVVIEGSYMLISKLCGENATDAGMLLTVCFSALHFLRKLKCRMVQVKT